MVGSPYATADDVQAIWTGRTLTAAERDTAELLCRYASAIIRSKVPSVDARLADGSLDPDLPTIVCSSVVIRYMDNPDRVTQEQESVGPFTRSVTFAAAVAGGLSPTDDELELLAPAKTSPGVGTITLASGLTERHRDYDRWKHRGLHEHPWA